MVNRFAVLAALVLALSAVNAGQQVLPRVAPAAAGLAPEVLDQATALLTQMVAEGKIAGAVAAVARRGQVGYLQAVGVQDLATRTPMSERSLFRIYSMTKAVTAVAAMTLFDDGKFRLDDPVEKYLPEFASVQVVPAPGAAPRPPARPITVEDLLLHTSGLSHRTSELYRDLGVRSRTDALPAFVAKIARAPLMEDPHTRFRYSEATTVLGRLVEVWSGQPFDLFLERRIFQPLGMTDTVFAVDPIAATGWPPSTARLPAAVSSRWRWRPCRSPCGRNCSKAPWVWCRASPTSSASARCCWSGACSAARGSCRPRPRPV